MDSPIQLKFFKKLELYQEYKFEEAKYKNSRFRAWDVEKKILKWTRRHHYHLGSALSVDRIKREILSNEYSHDYEHGIENLLHRGWAEHPSTIEKFLGSIIITKTGLLMGEVIDDVENHPVNMYRLLLYMIWVTAISGFIVITAESIDVIINLLLNCSL